jgi:hypothetical protein
VGCGRSFPATSSDQQYAASSFIRLFKVKNNYLPS